MLRWVGLAGVLLGAGGCAHPWHLYAIPQCPDGLPVQILTDPRCPPDGICGYSCLPDRWQILTSSAALFRSMSGRSGIAGK